MYPRYRHGDGLLINIDHEPVALAQSFVFLEESPDYLFRFPAFAVGWLTYVSALFSTAAVLVGLVDSSADSLSLAPRAWRLLVSRGFPEDVVDEVVGTPEDE